MNSRLRSSPRVHWHQLRLRTLLIAMTLVPVALAWWFQPSVVESRYEDGTPRTRFALRRDWQGRRVAHGQQTWFHRDGSTIERTNYGEPITDDDFSSLLRSGPDPNWDYLIWLITNTIEPESWDDVDSANRYYTGGALRLLPDE